MLKVYKISQKTKNWPKIENFRTLKMGPNVVSIIEIDRKQYLNSLTSVLTSVVLQNADPILYLFMSDDV